MRRRDSKMPCEGKVLGFSNRWYKYALGSAAEVGLPDGTAVRIVSAPAFVATKLDAFCDRGGGDFLMSHDIEDIIAVVDGRPELCDEIASADSTVRQFISSSITNFLRDPNFEESVKMSLLPDEVSQARANLLLERMRLIAAL